MERTVKTLFNIAMYAAAGLAVHLVFYGDVEWASAFTYVAMAFWPVLLLWELLIGALIVAAVVAVGLAAYFQVEKARGEKRLAEARARAAENLRPVNKREDRADGDARR